MKSIIETQKTKNIKTYRWCKYPAPLICAVVLQNLVISTAIAEVAPIAATLTTGDAGMLNSNTTQPLIIQEQKISVKGYEFEGDWQVTTEELEAVLADNIDKQVTFSDLENQADELMRYLRSKGYFVATVYVPPQDFHSGIIRFAVVIGNYEDIIIKENTAASQRAVLRELGSLKSGKAVSRNDLERGILLIGDLPRTNVRTYLQAGEAVGTSDLIVETQRKGKDFWGYIGYDNGGYRYTGRYQYSIFMNYASPFKNGDLLSLGGVKSSASDGMWSGSATYVTPLVSQGMKLGISYARSHYSLGGLFSSLNHTGQSDGTSIWVQQNILRTRRANLFATVRFSKRDLSEDTVAYALKNPKTLKGVEYIISGDSDDDLWGGGRNNFTISYSKGSLRLEDSASAIYDAITAKTAGNYGKYQLTLSRLQQIDDRTSLALSYKRQWADKNLDSAEKLSLGGSYGVRAYSLGEASGDDGFLWSAELRHLLPVKEGYQSLWQLVAFVDGGRVNLYHKTWATYTGKTSRSLYGAGIGVNWNYKEQWSARLNYAWRLGSGDGASDSNRGRFWFQLYNMF